MTGCSPPKGLIFRKPTNPDSSNKRLSASNLTSRSKADEEQLEQMLQNLSNAPAQINHKPIQSSVWQKKANFVTGKARLYRLWPYKMNSTIFTNQGVRFRYDDLLTNEFCDYFACARRFFKRFLVIILINLHRLFSNIKHLQNAQLQLTLLKHYTISRCFSVVLSSVWYFWNLFTFHILILRQLFAYELFCDCLADNR